MPKIIGRNVASGEKIIFNCPDGKVLRYSVCHGSWSYITNETGENHAIFESLGIADKCTFVRSLGIETHGGGFPEVRSLHDLTKVINALYDLCEKKDTPAPSYRTFYYRDKQYRLDICTHRGIWYYATTSDYIGSFEGLMENTFQLDKKALAKPIQGIYRLEGNCPEFITSVALQLYGDRIQHELNRRVSDEREAAYVAPPKSDPVYQYKINDTVIFELRGKKYKYTVISTYLRSETEEHNNAILVQLGYTTPAARRDFIDKIIGYASKHENHGFPEFKYDDLEALNKIIDAVKLKCEQVDAEEALIAMSEESPTPKKVYVEPAEDEEEDDEDDYFDHDEDEEDEEEYLRDYRVGDYVSFQVCDKIYAYTVTRYGLAYSGFKDWYALYADLGIDAADFWIKHLPYSPNVYHTEKYAANADDGEALDDVIRALKAECARVTKERDLRSPKPVIAPSSASLDIPLDGLEVEELTVHNSIIL